MNKFLKKPLNYVFEQFISEQFSDTHLQDVSSSDFYQQIFETRPIAVPKQSDLELHMLVCERDFLRSFWALKSFYRYSGLRAKLVIQNDGSLSDCLLDRYHEHFPGCVINTDNDNEIRAALTGYPMCQFFLKHHAIAKKLLHPLLLAKAEYLLIMDSDILWFKQSRAITKAVKKHAPFYVDGGIEVYVRNQEFMESRLELYPAENVNTGIIGYQKLSFLDLEFIESVIKKLVYIPKDLLPESIGYIDESVNLASEDIHQTLCWWVMEQTIYALLMGRERQRQMLKSWSDQWWERRFGDLHQFSISPIFRGTALIHYITDRVHNQLFPVGVQHLMNRRFLEELS